MAIINFRIYTGFDRKNRSGCNFNTAIHYPLKILLINAHKIEIANTKITRICSQAKFGC